MRRRKTITFACAFVLASIATVAVAQPRKDRLTVDLFLDWEMVASPQISPNGKEVVYTRRWTDKINDKYEDEIWIMDADGVRNRFLVKGSQAVWSPDGRRLAYVAPGQPTGAQIFVKWMDAPGETQLTHLEQSPSNLAWSLDGKRIAFNMLVKGDPALKIRMPERPSGAKWIEPPRVVDRLNYRADGSGWRPEGFSHIFVISDDGGTPRRLTDGDYQHGAPRWTNDSSGIIFSGVRKDGAEYIRGASEIYQLSLAGGPIGALTERNGPDANPVLSPDGKLIAYVGFDQTDNTYTVNKLYLMNADGSQKRALALDLDRSPGGLIWANDNTGIYFTVEDRGSNNLHFQPVGGGTAKLVTQSPQILNISSISKNGIAVGTRSTPNEPLNVVALDTRNPASIRKLTDVNGDLLEGRKLGAVEEIWYDSVGGTRIQGWIVKPPDFNSARKYPLILYIHGGPHSMYGVGFNFEFQNHAAEDYVVLYTNPRSSSGYGSAFGNAIKNAYPGQDYDDIMRGVDEVIKRGYVDERNLFVTGGSGGGVLTTWIVGHTDRFAAAVAMKPVTNWYSFVGTTDGADWYYNFKKLPWEDPSEHLQRSPLTYVGKVKTPTMILTGDLDLRTPLEQTEQYYRALKMRKVDTAMVRLTDEFHGFNAEFSLRYPSNRVAQSFTCVVGSRSTRTKDR